VRFDDPEWVRGAAPAQPDRVTVERELRYDAAGELSDALDRRRGWVQYDYDPAGRLLSVVREATGEGEHFRYDVAGNLYEADRDESEARVYGPGGRLLRHGETIYTWDEAGRLAEKRSGDDGWRYRWDTAGRLVSVELPDGRRAEYAYDPLGRRVEARLLAARVPGERVRLAERTRFVWDGDTLAHALRSQVGADGDAVIEERTFCFEDGSFVPWAQGDDTPDGFGGRRRTWAFFVNDPIGTPDELVGGDGAVLGELDRRAWGRTDAISGGRAETPLRFQGQQEDGETGLFYNRFRYYDPEVGLYLSPDPIGLAGGLRPFGYVPNPTGWVDPFGLDWNYQLRDSSTKQVYYVGRASDNETPGSVMSRHANPKRSLGSDGIRFRGGRQDQLEVITPPQSTKEMARGIEDCGVREYGTNIGRRKCNGNRVRGNNIKGIDPRNPNKKSYDAAASAYLTSQGASTVSALNPIGDPYRRSSR
jgi:RHS repeat-associated protein